MVGLRYNFSSPQTKSTLLRERQFSLGIGVVLKGQYQLQYNQMKKSDVINQFLGVSWAYSKNVKKHFFHPKNFLIKDVNTGKFDAEGIVGSPACVLPTTLIQRNSSFTTIKDIKIGDKVFSNDGLLHEISKTFKTKYNTKTITLKNQIGKITCSTDHLIYAMPITRKEQSPFIHTKDKQKLPAVWEHAENLKKGDIVLYPIPKYIKKIQYINLPAQKKKKHDFNSRILPDKIPLNKDVLEMFGYFISEGHTTSTSGVVGFTFNSKESGYAEHVKYVMDKYFGLPTSIKNRIDGNRIDVAINNIFLSKLFKEWFGISASKKQIPEFLLFLPPVLQINLIRGIWQGDGYFNPKRFQPRAGFATISEKLTNQMVWLLLRQKIVPSIYEEKEKTKNGVNHKKSFRIHVGNMFSLEILAKILEIDFKQDPSKYHTFESWFDNNYLYLPIRNKKIEKFKGDLYNLEVNETHNYTTDSFLIHNCGDIMRVWLKINSKTDRIKEFKWRTFGCASAIAATSMLSVMATEKGGMKLDKAINIKPQDITKRLGGLPDRKIHCSVLGDKALRAAINNWFKKTGQHDRIIVEGGKVIDPQTKTTEADIEKAILDGARTLQDVQKRTKVGIGNPDCLPEVEEFIRFYTEKHTK